MLLVAMLFARIRSFAMADCSVHSEGSHGALTGHDAQDTGHPKSQPQPFVPFIYTKIIHQCLQRGLLHIEKHQPYGDGLKLKVSWTLEV